MKVAQVVNILRRSTILGGLHDEALNVLAFNGAQSSYGRNEEIIRRGDESRSAMVVLSGEVEIEPGGRSRSITAGPGTMIGELALLAARDAAADVTAVSDCEILRIDRELFGRMVAEFPDIASNLHDQLLHRMQKMMGDLAGLEAHLRHEPAAPVRPRQTPPSQAHGPRGGPSPAPNRRQ